MRMRFSVDDPIPTVAGALVQPLGHSVPARNKRGCQLTVRGKMLRYHLHAIGQLGQIDQAIAQRHHAVLRYPTRLAKAVALALTGMEISTTARLPSSGGRRLPAISGEAALSRRRLLSPSRSPRTHLGSCPASLVAEMGVCTENLNPIVAVMKPTEDRV